jgi:hypothetical protein
MTNSGYQDRKFLISSVLIAALVLFELLAVAERSNNWRGFVISTMHVVVVLVGVILATRNK